VATVVGEGPESGNLRQLSADLGLSNSVEFTGGVSSDRVTKLLEHSGILVLASETEGWPKAIVEAMAFGLIVIGSNVGLIPEIVSEGRGLTVPPRDVNYLAATLQQVLKAPDKYSEMRKSAAEWACQYSLESLRESLRILLEQHWGALAQDSTRMRASRSVTAVSSGAK
jgi:glycosyltransferase involved in cell wall biosynthesis